MRPPALPYSVSSAPPETAAKVSNWFGEDGAATPPSHRPPALPQPQPKRRPCSLSGGVSCAALEHGAGCPRQIKGPLSTSSAQTQPLCNADLCSKETATGMSGYAYLMGPQGVQIIPGLFFLIGLWAPLCHATVSPLLPRGHILTLLPASQSVNTYQVFPVCQALCWVLGTQR